MRIRNRKEILISDENIWLNKVQVLTKVKQHIRIHTAGDDRTVSQNHITAKAAKLSIKGVRSSSVNP